MVSRLNLAVYLQRSTLTVNPQARMQAEVLSGRGQKFSVISLYLSPPLLQNPGYATDKTLRYGFPCFFLVVKTSIGVGRVVATIIPQFETEELNLCGHQSTS